MANVVGHRGFFQVVTIVEKPFIFARPGSDCDPVTEVSCPRKKLNGNEKICPSVKHVCGPSTLDTINDDYEQFCCRGYCIALLQELSKNLSFVFTLHLVADNKYGSFEKVASGSRHTFILTSHLGGRR